MYSIIKSINNCQNRKIYSRFHKLSFFFFVRHRLVRLILMMIRSYVSVRVEFSPSLIRGNLFHCHTSARGLFRSLFCSSLWRMFRAFLKWLFRKQTFQLRRISFKDAYDSVLFSKFSGRDGSYRSEWTVENKRKITERVSIILVDVWWRKRER